jgi:hypothetical protein
MCELCPLVDDQPSTLERLAARNPDLAARMTTDTLARYAEVLRARVRDALHARRAARQLETDAQARPHEAGAAERPGRRAAILSGAGVGQRHPESD